MKERMTPKARSPQPEMAMACGRSGAPIGSTRRARASLTVALIAFAGGTVCNLSGRWGPGLILIFAGVAGVLTAWQIRNSVGRGI